MLFCIYQTYHWLVPVLLILAISAVSGNTDQVKNKKSLINQKCMIGDSHMIGHCCCYLLRLEFLTVMIFLEID